MIQYFQCYQRCNYFERYTGGCCSYYNSLGLVLICEIFVKYYLYPSVRICIVYQIYLLHFLAFHCLEFVMFACVLSRPSL